MTKDQIRHALNRHVPDMRQRAFNIQTSYGCLEIPEGPMADAITDVLLKHLESELARLQRREDCEAGLAKLARVHS